MNITEIIAAWRKEEPTKKRDHELTSLRVERLEEERVRLLTRVENDRQEIASLHVRLENVHLVVDKLAAERDALRAELSKAVARNVELERRQVTLGIEVDRLDAIRRQQEADNLDLLAENAKISEQNSRLFDALNMNKNRAREAQQ